MAGLPITARSRATTAPCTTRAIVPLPRRMLAPGAIPAGTMARMPTSAATAAGAARYAITTRAKTAATAAVMTGAGAGDAHALDGCRSGGAAGRGAACRRPGAGTQLHPGLQHVRLVDLLQDGQRPWHRPLQQWPEHAGPH